MPSPPVPELLGYAGVEPRDGAEMLLEESAGQDPDPRQLALRPRQGDRADDGAGRRRHRPVAGLAGVRFVFRQVCWHGRRRTIRLSICRLNDVGSVLDAHRTNVPVMMRSSGPRRRNWWIPMAWPLMSVSVSSSRRTRPDYSKRGLSFPPEETARSRGHHQPGDRSHRQRIGSAHRACTGFRCRVRDPGRSWRRYVRPGGAWRERTGGIHLDTVGGTPPSGRRRRLARRQLGRTLLRRHPAVAVVAVAGAGVAYLGELLYRRWPKEARQ